MKTSTIVWIIVVIVLVAGGWYWIAKSQSTSTATTTASGTAGLNGSANQTNTGQEAIPPAINIAQSATLGTYLVADNGMTLYRYTKDTSGVSNCTGACATAWPPYLQTVAEPLVATENATGTLMTLARTDGGTQITYNGMPLYFYANDAQPGDVTGQGVGGVWFVVKP